MGGKKKGGKEKAKAKEEKKKKQEAKAHKKASKKAKKNNDGYESEDDLDALLEEYRARDAERKAVTIEANAAAPSPRSNFSVCPLEGQSSNELFLFGGEFFDGSTSECFNELYRLNLEKLEWKKISSPNTPDPRNAHQAVTVRDQVYVFGGEFSHGYHFQHYRDLWKFDLNQNAWTNIETKTGPSPRSGHRMVLWKHFLVLYGGFYETSRGVKFYDDLYFFDLREEKWHLAVPSKTAQRPSARSGFQFVCNGSKNTVFMYGGYSKVSVSNSAERGRNLDDMWSLHLTLPGKAGDCPAFKWEPIPKRGSPPSRRSGASSCVHKNRMILFGGVTDNETANDVEGQFHNQLYSFDMDRLKWFALNLKSKKTQQGGGRRRNKDKTGVSVVSSNESYQSLDDQKEENDGDLDENEDEDYAYGDVGLDDNAFYVFIDGKLTKIEVDDEDEGESEENITSQQMEHGDPVTSEKDVVLKEAEKDRGDQLEKVSEEPSTDDPEPFAPVPEQQPNKETLPADGEDDSATQDAKQGDLDLDAPHPRIGAGLGTLGSKLFVFGGTTEVGDKQITFDDLWVIDLNQMDKWVQVIEGTWQGQNWKEERDDEEEDEDEEEDDEDEDEDDEEDDEDDDEEDASGQKLQSEKEMKAKLQRIKGLQEKLRLDDESKTPLPREALRDFFKRTADVWVRQVFAERQVQERMSGKELRREAFKLAADRFHQLFPILQELDELEEEQRLAEEMQEQEKQRLKDKLREKVKKRKAHMAKALKKEKREAAKKAEEAESSEDE